MAIDSYASCPCGSGKKFKWCCQDIHSDVDKAFEQHNAGQHEAALQTLKTLTDQHAGNPEAWGRYAQLLGLNGKTEEAEAALERAFAVNPAYAFGYLLRGQFRMAESELVGALSLFRKAAEIYSPDARDPLSYAFELIADLEMRLNRPIAARAALARAVALQSANAELKKAFDGMFGDASRLPACARREHAFRPPTDSSPEWKELLARAANGRLAEIRDEMVKWADSHASDPNSWFNLGLSYAWVGDNVNAIEALGKVVELDPDDARATEASTLIEVLKCGEGLEAEADYCEHRAIFAVRDANAVMNLLQHWEKEQRLVGVRANPDQGMLTALVLEEHKGLIETAEGPSTSKLGGYLLVAGSMMQLWHPNETTLDGLAAEAHKLIGAGGAAPSRQRGPIMFSDVVVEAMIFPTKATTELDAEIKVKENAATFFEEKWIHQPRKSLSGNTPIDAAGHKSLRRKLSGLIQFLQDCAAVTSVRLYDFDRLRRKLGLLEGGPRSESADITAMNAAELASVTTQGWSEAQFADAFRSAMKLDARELAGKFAAAAIALPGENGLFDRYPFYSHLITQAQQDSRIDEALSILDAALKHDCEHNGGRRRNDFELRRGQILAKNGDASAAEVFSALIDRAPDEPKYVGAAAEAMLAAKNGAAAQKFAESGLAKARATNNRDSEEYFLELAAAAKKLV